MARQHSAISSAELPAFLRSPLYWLEEDAEEHVFSSARCFY